MSIVFDGGHTATGHCVCRRFMNTQIESNAGEDGRAYVYLLGIKGTDLENVRRQHVAAEEREAENHAIALR
eukprot:COSAG06_NODE_26203_length_619_cov_2.313462_2_plen_70_part_01